MDGAIAGVDGEAWRVGEAVGRDRARLAIADQQGADDLAARGAQRRRGHRTQAHAVGDGDVVGIARDARVGEVARRPDDAALARREAVDAAVDREPLAAQPVRQSSVIPPATTIGVRYVRSSDTRVRWAPSEAEDALRLLDDQAEDGVRVADRGDAGGDLAQRSAPSRRGATVSSRERPSSRISSALWMAMVARSASAASRARPPGRRTARRSLENTASVPRTTASPISGAKAIDRIPARSKKSRLGAPSGNASSAAYSSVHDHAPLADGEMHAGATGAEGLPLRAGLGRRCPASCAQRTSPVAGSSRSMTAPDDAEQPAPPRRRRPGAAPPGPGSSSAAARSRAARAPRPRFARGRACDDARRSTSRALASATAAWPASASSSRRASSPKASRSRCPAWNTPTRPSSPTTGAVITECRFTSWTPSSPSV